MLVFSMTIVLFLVVSYSYIRNINTINKLEASSQQALLTLESDNLTSYVTQLDQYSLLLRSDESFMKFISSNDSLAQSNIIYIQNLLRVNFYSRNDLTRYDLYLVNQQTAFSISKTNRNIVMQPFPSLNELTGYESFTAGPYFRTISKTEKDNDFLIYYRTIIDIKTQKPLAIVKLTINNVYPDELARTQTENSEIFCISEKNGQILYSSDLNILGKNDSIENTIQPNKKTTASIITLNNEKYLLVLIGESSSGWSVFSLSPQNITDTLANSTRNISIIIGLIAMAIKPMTILILRVELAKVSVIFCGLSEKTDHPLVDSPIDTNKYFSLLRVMILAAVFLLGCKML